MYYTDSNCTHIFDAYLVVQCANTNFKYLAPEATLECCKRHADGGRRRVNQGGSAGQAIAMRGVGSLGERQQCRAATRQMIVMCKY